MPPRQTTLVEAVEVGQNQRVKENIIAQEVDLLQTGAGDHQIVHLDPEVEALLQRDLKHPIESNVLIAKATATCQMIAHHLKTRVKTDLATIDHHQGNQIPPVPEVTSNIMPFNLKMLVRIERAVITISHCQTLELTRE